MKQLLKQFASYNVWANQQITNAVLLLSPERQTEEIISSFNSLQKTVLHLWDAESLWWQRMRLQEKFVRPSDAFNGTMRDAVDGLLSQSRLWETWVANASDLSLDHVFEYRNNKKELNKVVMNQMLIHLFNHATYHRGQIVTMLRQLGVDKIPSTDFVFWAKLKK